MQVAETMLIAAAGGIGLNLSASGALVSGSMLAVADRRARCRPMKVPFPSGAPMFCAGRYLLGAVVTPETLRASRPGREHCVARRLGRFACSSPPPATYAWCIIGIRCRRYSAQAPARWRRSWRYRPSSALIWAAFAIVQVMRVLLIVLGLPAGLALFGSASDYRRCGA